MDNFEKYVQEHKNEFDEHKADREMLWAKIEGELPEQKVLPLWRSRSVGIAASLLFLVGLAASIGFFARNGTTEQTQFVDKELIDIDTHYMGLVSQQIELLQNHPNLSQEDKKEFLGFINELDAEYKVLRLEMNKNLDNEIVLEAIVKNYKKRIELIENLLDQINGSKIIDDDYGYTL